MVQIDTMEGAEFEKWCVHFLKFIGFYDIVLTKKGADQGVDIVAWKDNVSYAVQCKRYGNKVSNKAVQEIYAGQKYYNCQKAIVITNNTFTSSAIKLAKATNVILWDRNQIIKEYDRALYLLQSRVQGPTQAHQYVAKTSLSGQPQDKYNPLYHNRNVILRDFAQFAPPKFQPVDIRRRRLIAIILAVILGFVGMHNIYLKRNKIAAMQLLVGFTGIFIQFFPLIIAAELWALAEAVLLIVKKINCDGNGMPLV